MSRIGKKPVPVPAGVTAAIEGKTLSVKGPKGNLTMAVSEGAIFDGYPRTAAQAVSLDEILASRGRTLAHVQRLRSRDVVFILSDARFFTKLCALY